MASFVSSVGMLFILLAKIGLRNHISVRWQHYINLLFFVLLALPFIPEGFFSFAVPPMRFGDRQIVTAIATAGNGPQLTYGMGWLQDFAVPVSSVTSGYPWLMIAGIWFAGIMACTVMMLWCNKSFRLIKESVKPVEDGEILSLFASCKVAMGVGGNIILGTSILIKSPMTVGLFKTIIILPAKKIALKDMRYAILHELAHCKNRDIQINAVMCMFQILYWFNPLIYFIFKQMRLDREIACDDAVLKTIPKAHHTDYGETLLNFIKTISHPTPAELFLMAGMGGSKPQIVKRIRYIASYAAETGRVKTKSVCAFALIVIFVFCQIPVISALAHSNDSRFHFRADNVIYEDFSAFFGEFEGSFVLYDLENGLYTIHNRDMSLMRVSPFSTYKIYSALIALEVGVLEANDTLREWDGAVQPFEAWSQNHDLTSAMHSSVNWYFQDMDALVGIEMLQSYLSRISYGNSNLSGGIADFWNGSSLRISPVEQVQALRRLHHNAVFDAGHVEALKDVLRLSERDGAVLFGKTGTGSVDGWMTSNHGWFIGYVESDGRTFIFATYVEGDDHAGGSAAAQITLTILEDMGVY